MSWPAVCARGPVCPQPVMRPYTRRGFALRQTSGPRPSRSITPGRNPSISTSAPASMQRTAATPSALRRFSAPGRWWRRFTSAGSAFAERRSTVTTSAPRSASNWPTSGPGPMPLNSTTRSDVNGPLMSTSLAFVQTKPAADDLLHGLGRAGVDAADAGVGIEAADFILVHVAGAAVQLQAFVDHPAFDLGGVELGSGRDLGRELPLHVLHDAMVDQGPACVDTCTHVGHLEAGVLESADDASEGLPIGDVGQGHFERSLGTRDIPDCTGQAFLGKIEHQVAKAVGRLAQHVRSGHLHVLEEQLGRVLAVQAELLELAPALEAGHAFFDYEEANRMRR